MIASGIWVLGMPRPEPLAALAGQRRVLDTAHRLVGNIWSDEGLTREQRAWVADPDLIRRLDVGQACYIHSGTATFVHVAAAAYDTSPLPVVPGAFVPVDAELLSEPSVGPRDLLAAFTWQLPARIRFGRPLRLLLRGAVAALPCVGVLALIPGDPPAAPPLVASLITWFEVTGRSDLAPPRHR